MKQYTISSTSELSIDELEKYPEIEEIQVLDRTDDIAEPKDADIYTTYTRDEYIEIKKQIEKIKQIVDKAVKQNPQINDEDKEKNIFIAIYLLLGKIKFDHKTEEQEQNKTNNMENSKNARNLYGGLINGKSVCLGHSQILKNVLSEYGIKSKCIIGIPQLTGYFNSDIENSENTINHAWNIVNLDGKDYQCDLSMDADGRLSHSYRGIRSLKYCLTGEEDFRHNKYDIAPLKDGLTLKEQSKLMEFYMELYDEIEHPEDFEEREDDPLIKQLIEESKNVEYIYDEAIEEEKDDIDEEEIRETHMAIIDLLKQQELKENSNLLFSKKELTGEDIKNILISINSRVRNIPVGDNEIYSNTMYVGELISPNNGVQERCFDKIANALKNIDENRNKGAMLHYLVNELHLFEDGNGRTGRCIFEMFTNPNFSFENDDNFSHKSDTYIKTSDFEGNKGIKDFSIAFQYPAYLVYKALSENKLIDQAENYISIETFYEQGLDGAQYYDKIFIDDSIKDTLSKKQLEELGRALCDNNEELSVSGLTMMVMQKMKGKEIPCSQIEEQEGSFCQFMIAADDDESRKTFEDWSREDYLKAIRYF